MHNKQVALFSLPSLIDAVNAESKTKPHNTYIMLQANERNAGNLQIVLLLFVLLLSSGTLCDDNAVRIFPRR